jgi:uncharacterized protein (TIGR00375 family)
MIADFHIHSKYSRAVSPKMNLEGLDEFAKIKGVDLMASGDVTHPDWFLELKEKLEPSSDGLFKLKNSKNNTHFILSGEISLIYSKWGKVRKVHVVVLCPSFDIVDRLNKKLATLGNLKSDGRPILGLDAKEFLKICLDISKDIMVIPAHIMTPWFGLYGSKSGFDSIEDCFEELSEYIYAYETGLSADPYMLLAMKECRERTLLSNSDAHSLEKIGREANVFDCDLNYYSIIDKIKKNDLHTLEFYPEEGKYFNDGHRNCGININPKDSFKYGELCPVCSKPLTIGVLNRVSKLADRDFNEKDKERFRSLVPLKEILSEIMNVGITSKAIDARYSNLIQELGSEFHILLEEDIDNIKKIDDILASAIDKVRKGDISIVPGYDGEFGKIGIFSDKEKKETIIRQETLL